MATRIETCNVCGEKFNTTRSGDKHRVIDFKYMLARDLSGRLVRINMEEMDSVVSSNGFKIVSLNNEHRRCLTPDEMRGIGMNQEKSGVWNGGGNWIGAPWK